METPYGWLEPYSPNQLISVFESHIYSKCQKVGSERHVNINRVMLTNALRTLVKKLFQKYYSLLVPICIL